MSTYSMIRNRFSLAMLPLSGILVMIGLVLRGAFGNPAVDASGFAQTASSPNFATAWVILLLGTLVRIYSLVVIYEVLAQLRAGAIAFWGLIFSFVAEVIFQSLTGFLAFALPVASHLYLQGNTGMLDVINAGFFTGPVTSLLYPSGLIGTIGSILFGIAIWRSGSLPKWAGIIYILTTPLLAFAPAFSYPLELLGGVLFLVSGTWIAAAAWGMNSNTEKSPMPQM